MKKKLLIAFVVLFILVGVLFSFKPTTSYDYFIVYQVNGGIGSGVLNLTAKIDNNIIIKNIESFFATDLGVDSTKVKVTNFILLKIK